MDLDERHVKWAKSLVELSRRIHLLQIGTVIVGGSGSKNMLIGIRTAWEQNPETKGKKFPLVCSLGQLETSTREKSSLEVQQIISKRLGAHFESARKGRVYVIDECLHQGTTVERISDALLKLGFRPPRFGVLMVQGVNSNRKWINGRKLKLDYVGDVGGGCPVFKGRRSLFLLVQSLYGYKNAIRPHLVDHAESVEDGYKMVLENYPLTRRQTLEALAKSREATRSAVKSYFKRKPIILP